MLAHGLLCHPHNVFFIIDIFIKLKLSYLSGMLDYAPV